MEFLTFFHSSAPLFSRVLLTSKLLLRVALTKKGQMRARVSTFVLGTTRSRLNDFRNIEM
jgi:hypothetical protein